MANENPPDAATAWHEHNISQLRHFRSLSLRARLEAVQGMADVVRHFRQMRVEGRFKESGIRGGEARHPADHSARGGSG